MESLSTTELFAAVLANQLVMMGALRRLVAGQDVVSVIEKQMELTLALLEAAPKPRNPVQ